MRIIVIAVVALAGCVATPSSTVQREVPSMSAHESPRASLIPASVQPQPDGEGSRLSGTLGADAVEGGCAYLQAPDGTRYEVIYPDGWRVELSPLRLLDPNGAVVASGGDEITVVGQPADDMASICQIGPIFRATEVER
jgi:hypothetical protein